MIETGIKFGDIHSFFNLNLILSNVDIPPAKPKTTYVDIPGGDGTLDLTETHGEVKYFDRELKFTFTMNPNGGLSDADFEAKKTEVSNALNGLNCKITLDKDEEYYYLGRCTVSDYASNKKLRQIKVTAKVYPYKFKRDVTVLTLELPPTTMLVNVVNGRRSVVPEITCTDDDTKVVFGEVEAMLSAGTHKILDFQLKQGRNEFYVLGSGAITFTYQEAEL